MSTVGQTVKERNEVCPCPVCTTRPGQPPGPALPAHMPNTSYVSSYLLVSAANATRPLLCRPGRTPTGSFTCVTESRFFGAWVTPYPTCEASVCSMPPDISRVAHSVSFDTARSTDGIDCSLLSHSSPMRHGGSCAITCESGWKSEGSFLCHEGVFQLPWCYPQICNDTTFAHGTVDCAAFGGPVVGSLCPVVCDPGYEPIDSHVRCAMHQDGVMPAFTPAPVCRRSSCGSYSHTMGALVVYPPNSSMAMGDTAEVTCDSEHLANGVSFSLRCGPKQGAVWSSGVEWQLASTGARAGLLCARAGTEVHERITLQGRLIAEFRPPAGTSLRSMCTGQDFVKNVAISIALSLASISQRTVRVADVHDIRLSTCGQGRRLSAERTILLYSVFVPNEDAAAFFTGLLSNAAIDSSFERTLAEALRQSSGWTAQALDASPLGVDLFYATEAPTQQPVTTTTLGRSVSRSPNSGVVAAAAEDNDAHLLLAVVLGSVGGAICIVLCSAFLFFWVRRRRRTYEVSVFPVVREDDPEYDDLAMEDATQDLALDDGSASYTLVDASTTLQVA